MDYRASEYLMPVFDYGILHLELNTALFILVLFLGVMFALNRLLFQPVLRTLDNRQAVINGLQEDIAAKEAEIARMETDYRQRLTVVRDEVTQYRQEQRRQAGDEAADILSAARQEAEQTLQQAMGELEDDVMQVRAEVMDKVSPLAQQISTRMLGR